MNVRFKGELSDIEKISVKKQKILIKYFITERTNLLKLYHPFIMKLVRTY